MCNVRLPALAVLALLVSACGTDADTAPPTRPGAPEITAFTAAPETVAPGEASTLTWEVSGDAPTLTIEATDFRPVTVTGETSYVARPTVTTTYVLVARNAVDTDRDEVTVTVGAADTAE